MLALLAEARTALEGEAPLDDAAVERWGAYVRMLEEWREEAERRCDAQRTALPAVDGVGLAELDGEGLDRATAAEIRREPKTCPPSLRRKGQARLRLLLERDFVPRAAATRTRTSRHCARGVTSKASRRANPGGAARERDALARRCGAALRGAGEAKVQERVVIRQR